MLFIETFVLIHGLVRASVMISPALREVGSRGLVCLGMLLLKSPIVTIVRVIVGVIMNTSSGLGIGFWFSEVPV